MEKVCCVCHRVKRAQGWIKGEKRLEMTKLSHGYCPQCYRETMRKMHAYGVELRLPLGMGLG